MVTELSFNYKRSPERRAVFQAQHSRTYTVRERASISHRFRAATLQYLHTSSNPMTNPQTIATTNRVSSKKFTNERGKDHSAFDAACEMAQVLDGNMWPWVIERDGEEILHGWGGDQLGSYRFQG